jgi:hypothetical protein
MMARRYYAGFSFERIGTFTLSVTNDKDGKNYFVQFATGSHYHDLSDGAAHTSFASRLQTALNAAAAAAASTATYAVTFDNATLRYELGTFAPFAATLGGIAQSVLGMPVSVSRATVGDPSPTSTRTPDFVIATAVRGTSQNSGDVHLRGQIRGGITDSGKTLGLGPSTRAVMHRWAQRHEPKASTFRYAANNLWTWEDLYLHCGTWEPFVVCKSAGSVVTYADDCVGRFHLHGPDATFEPTPTFVDYDDRWDVPFSTVVHDRQSL